MSYTHDALRVAALVVLSACSSDPSTSDDPPTPAPETLFDSLPAASPNKLRGVWSTTQEQAGGTIEIRIRFIEKYIVGAAKCSPKAGDAVIAGGTIGLDTTALDAANGKVTIGSLVMDKKTDTVQCQAQVPGGSYDFTVEDAKLTLTMPNAAGSLQLAKVGD